MKKTVKICLVGFLRASGKTQQLKRWHDIEYKHLICCSSISTITSKTSTASAFLLLALVKFKI